jgi:hypothetical protein
MAIRVRVYGQDDHISQEAASLLVRTAHELIDRLDELLCAENLGGMQPSINPDDGLAFGSQGVRLRVGQPLGERETA